MNDLQIISRVLFEPSDIIEIRCIKGQRPNSVSRSLWCTAAELPSKGEQLDRLNKQGWNLYFGVNPRKQSGGTKSVDVALARCCFTDFDDKDCPMLRPSCGDGAGLGRYEFVLNHIIDAGLPEPSLVVSSGNGMHCYWRLAEPIYDAAEFKAAQENLIDLLGSDGAVKDFSRIMRLPPFDNVKDESNPKECFVIYPTRTL